MYSVAKMDYRGAAAPKNCSLLLYIVARLLTKEGWEGWITN